MPTWRVPVTLTWPGSGSPGVNVFHVRTSVDENTWPNTELQDAVDAIHAFYNSVATLSLGSGYPLASGVVCSLGTVSTVDTQREQSPAWSNITSPAGYSVAPPHLAAVIGWRTTTAARRARGRTFIGPLGSGAIQNDGTINDTLLSGLRSAAQTLVDASAGVGGWAIGVYGQENMMSGPTVTPEARQAAPHVLRDITGMKVRDQFAVLRSRRD